MTANDERNKYWKKLFQILVRYCTKVEFFNFWMTLIHLFRIWRKLKCCWKKNFFYYEDFRDVKLKILCFFPQSKKPCRLSFQRFGNSEWISYILPFNADPRRVQIILINGKIISALFFLSKLQYSRCRYITHLM